MRKIFLIVFLASMTFVFGGYERDAAAEVSIIAGNIRGDIPIDPAHNIWRSSSVVSVPLDCQTITEPKNIRCATTNVLVSAVTNGKEIGIRLEWSDQSKDELNIKHENYRDAAAIQFVVKPVKPGDEPAYTMGDVGDMVNIWHWKSEWQKDAGRRVDMEDVYPD